MSTACPLYLEESLINSRTICKDSEKFISPEALLNRYENSTLSKLESISSASSSSLSSSNSGHPDEIDSSTPYKYTVNGMYVFTLVTAKNAKGEFYHVVEEINKSVCKSIENYDRLVCINKDDVKNNDAMYVRQIMPFDQHNSMDSCKKIQLKLTFWRWNKSSISERVVKIVTKPSWKESKIPPKRTPKSNIQWKHKDKIFYIKAEFATGKYLCVKPETKSLSAESIYRKGDEKFQFYFSFFTCMLSGPHDTVLHRYGCTISCKISGELYDVCVEYPDQDITIKPYQPKSNDTLDGRYFIIYEMSDNFVLELLIYPNQCVMYNKLESNVQVRELGMSRSRSKRSFVNPKPQFIFNTFRPPGSREIEEWRSEIFAQPNMTPSPQPLGFTFLCCGSPFSQFAETHALDGIVERENEFKFQSEEEIIIQFETAV